MTELYIGLMSGTSADGIDAVLVDLSKAQPKILATHYQEYSSELRYEILALCQPGTDELNRLGELDVKLGRVFAEATNTLLANHSLKSNNVRAIGSHGQTIRHNPEKYFTLQIGDPNIIAATTGITTIADFRRRDIASGGQGAPLVPAFHQAILAKKNSDRAIVNIGGIANVTLLLADGAIFGFDTGPGNALLDVLAEKHLQQRCDKNGAWGAQGKIHREILNNLLNDPYFNSPPPKSTGRDYFNLAWVEKFFPESTPPADIQATLTELTAQSIVDSVSQHLNAGEILVCGGGVYNDFLMTRLKTLAKNFSVDTTQICGVAPEWVEAMAFAWLAKQTLEKKPGNIAAVTGAKQATILGGVFFP